MLISGNPCKTVVNHEDLTRAAEAASTSGDVPEAAARIPECIFIKAEAAAQFCERISLIQRQLQEDLLKFID